MNHDSASQFWKNLHIEQKFKHFTLPLKVFNFKAGGMVVVKTRKVEVVKIMRSQLPEEMSE